jgi:hypothetical protein
MRSFQHWTPRYIYKRIGLLLYEKRHPDYPWLTEKAIRLLDNLLRLSDVGLEWGSGRSTLWFARRVGHLTSVEHDPAWYKSINTRIKEAGVANVTYLLREAKEEDEQYQKEVSKNNPYVNVVNRFPKNSLDFVLVDGIFRRECAYQVQKKIRPGGILVVDNANWFLPCVSFAPNSRSMETGPASAQWGLFLTLVVGWSCTWTTNGVFDTAIWIKPI